MSANYRIESQQDGCCWLHVDTEFGDSTHLLQIEEPERFLAAVSQYQGEDVLSPLSKGERELIATAANGLMRALINGERLHLNVARVLLEEVSAKGESE